MAALGELEFEMFGFLCQASAVVVSPILRCGYALRVVASDQIRLQFESSRLVMIQLLLQDLKAS
jgi:hypothetical protein